MSCCFLTLAQCCCLILCLLFSNAGSSSSNYSQSVYYISWTSEDLPSIVDYGHQQVLTEVQASDDSPLVRVDLPFPFPLFGVEISTLYVNSNGAVHVSPKYPCKCSCFFDESCNYDTSYDGVIAAFLADLDPSDAAIVSSSAQTFPIAHMTTDHDGSELMVFTWENFPYFDSARSSRNSNWIPLDQNTFRLFINRSGEIAVAWDKVYPNSTVAHTSPIVGLRNPLQNSRSPSRAKYTETQKHTGESIWDTSVFGVYPLLKALVATGTAFHICPLSELVSMSPIYFRQGSGVRMNIRPLSSTCLDRISIVASLAGASTDWRNESFDIIACSISNGSITCPILSIPEVVSQSGVKNYSAILGWRPLLSEAEATGSFLPLPWQPLNFTVYASNGPSIDHLPSSSCGQNLQMPASCQTQNSSCLLHDGDKTCLNLQCPHEGLYYYVNPICDTGSNNTVVCSSDQFYDGNTCCVIGDVDCSGLCNGSASVGTNRFNGQYICCVPPMLLLLAQLLLLLAVVARTLELVVRALEPACLLEAVRLAVEVAGWLLTEGVRLL